MKDQYQTAAQETSCKLKIERSEFIAYIKETPDEETAKQFIAAISTMHKQATHNCPAYRIGLAPEEITYSSDDGEPSGTAGKPILGAIMKNNLTDTTIVVTRYFGGKKLGVRGLIDAYQSAAEAVIEKSGISTKTLCQQLKITTSYAQQGNILYLAEKFQAAVLGTSYTDQVCLSLSVPLSQKDNLLNKLHSLTDCLVELT